MPLIIMLKILLQLEPGAHFTSLKRSWRKVMFLHLSVILFTGGSVRGVPVQGVSVQGSLCPGDLHPGGVSVQGWVSVWGVLSGRPLPVRVKNGEYASYWNAFLLCIKLFVVSRTQCNWVTVQLH